MNTAKKILLLFFILFIPQATTHSCKAIDLLFCVGGAACASLFGYALYKTCQPLSDQEELNHAQCMLNNAKNLHSSLLSRYSEFLSCLHGHQTELCTIKYIIKKQHHRFPFLYFKSTLSRKIKSIRRKKKDLQSKGQHLLERKWQLAQDQHEASQLPLSDSERYYYIKQYEHLHQQIKIHVSEFKLLQSELEQLESVVMSFPEYREELLLSHIHDLENSIDLHTYNSYHQNYVHHYDPYDQTNCNTTYYDHTTPVYNNTVVHVHESPTQYADHTTYEYEEQYEYEEPSAPLWENSSTNESWNEEEHWEDQNNEWNETEQYDLGYSFT